jgi:RNA polymerase sigma-70 factor (ECF subfamily)
LDAGDATSIQPRTLRRVEAGDAELIEQARGGDMEAFAQLVRRYERRVRAVLSRLLDDERDLEEATQDTFVQAWRALDRFRAESATFTWLYRIAVNEALQRQRRRRPTLVELDEGLEAHDEPGPPAAAEVADLRDFLIHQVRSLPFEYRAPLVLRDIEGLSNDEAARVLEISVAALKSRLHRARMQIRSAFEAWEADLSG